MGNNFTAAKTVVGKNQPQEILLDHYGHSSCAELMLKMIWAYQNFEKRKIGEVAAFSPNLYRTIGIQMASSLKSIDGSPCKVRLRASNGQERYRTIILPKDFHGGVFYYDCGEKSTFNIVASWLETQSSQEPVLQPVILVGFNTGKCRVVSAEDAHDLVQRCKGLSLTYSEVNVDEENIDADTVETMYNALAAKCLQALASSEDDIKR